MRIGLALLTYNEIEGLTALYDRIRFELVDERLAVDGGSTDGTLPFLRARELPLHVQLAHKGRGEAFRIAFEQTTADALIFFSPDGNEDPADLSRFRPLLEAGHDMVVASRMMPGAHNEEDELHLRWRKWGNQAFNRMANATWNRKPPYITDTINGYRAITRAAWQRMQLDGEGYLIEYQSTIRAFKLGLDIAEFPTFEGPRLGGESYARSIPTGLRFLQGYLRELLIGRRFSGPDRGA